MIVAFLNSYMHSIRYMGCIFAFITMQVVCDNIPRRSVVFEDDGFELVKTLPDGSEEVWDIIPNQEIQISDDVDFCWDNQDSDESIIVEKEGAGKTISFEVLPGESAQIVESVTGETGLLQTHTDGTQNLHPVGRSVDFEEKIAPPNQNNQQNQVVKPLNSSNNREQWRNVTDKFDESVTVFPSTCDSIKLPSNRVTDSYDTSDSYDESIKESASISVQGYNWSTYLLAGGSAALLLIGYCYVLNNIKACIRYLSRDDLWSSWKSEESYGVLLMMKPKYLANDLMRDINVVYYQEADSMGLFLNDIQEEADTIMTWMQFRNLLYRFSLPLGNEFDMLENRLHLLDLMRKAVYYWRSQQLSIEPKASQ